jgi:hypothetical protein
MTDEDKSAIHFLIDSCEACASNIATSLRSIEAARQLATRGNATALHRFIATLDVESAMGAALIFIQRSEQLFSKLREIVPAIEDDEL